MDSIDPLLHDALDLRLGEAEVPLAPADVAAFARPLRARGAAAERATDDLEPRDEALDDALAADRLLIACAALADGALLLELPTDARLLPLDADGGWPIPAPQGDSGADDLEAPTDLLALGTWSIEPVSEAMIAIAPARGPGAGWRSLVVAAVSLPLVLGAGEVWAAPAVQRPKSASEAPAAASTPAPEAPPAAPELPSEPSESGEAADAPEAERLDAAAPEDAPPPAGPPERHLQAMRGQEVSIVLAGGGRRKGRLVDVQGATILFVDYSADGKIVEVPKAEIMEVRGLVAYDRPAGVPDPRLPDGRGSLIGGGVAVGVGAPFFLASVVLGGFCPSCISVTLPLLVPGLVGLGAGIPLLVRGARRRRISRESAFKVARVTPSAAPVRGGWTGGLTLRF
ncbi:MAG: hypothetical protein R3B09_16140 [Nannocystaceae bacterium]